MILAGRVLVNGRQAALGDTADPAEDTIAVDGSPLPEKPEFVYLMLNKPRGYITTVSDDRGRQEAGKLVEDCGVRVYPVGRLDMDSDGLLLFTNDGDFANRMTHPSHEVDKTYRVFVRGFTEEGLQKLRQPVELDGYRIRRPLVRVTRPPRGEGRAELEVTIHEGRNRQVRRMCDLAGMQVLRLTRIAEGNLHLGNLSSGKWRYLTREEMEKLK